MFILATKDTPERDFERGIHCSSVILEPKDVSHVLIPFGQKLENQPPNGTCVG